MERASQLETDTSDRGETVQSREIGDYLPLKTAVPMADLSISWSREYASRCFEVLSNPSRDASYDVNGMNSMVHNFSSTASTTTLIRPRTMGYSMKPSSPHPMLYRSSRVQTDNFSAEYGRAAGAGHQCDHSQRHHQQLSRRCLRLSSQHCAECVWSVYRDLGSKPTLVQNQFGGTVGGPDPPRQALLFSPRL